MVPILTAPPNETEVSYPDPSRAITLLMWNAVETADSYRVIVDFSRTFARPLIDRQGYEDTQMDLRGLETGTYYWKVAAVGAEGGEGGFAPVSRFSVLKAPAVAAKAPPLAVDTLELKGNVLHVRGQTTPGASLTLNGIRIEVQPDGVVQRVRHVRDQRDGNRPVARHQRQRWGRRAASTDRGLRLRTPLARVAVFGGAALKRRLGRAPGAGLEYEFQTLPGSREHLELPARRFAGALVEAGPETRPGSVRAVRQALPGKPVGGVAVTPDGTALRRLGRLGFDFVLEVWRTGDPPPGPCSPTSRA